MYCIVMYACGMPVEDVFLLSMLGVLCVYMIVVRISKGRVRVVPMVEVVDVVV